MYTGIIQATYPVTHCERREDLLHYGVQFESALMDDLQLGASVAIDGVCQTVCKIDEAVDGATYRTTVYFDAMVETLDKTTLGELQPGSRVNVERSAKIGQENGGHDISGHIDGTLDIVGIDETEDNYVLTLKLPAEFVKYVFEKGFLAIHGASLTVSNLDKAAGTFQVFLIPETLRLTVLDDKQVGDKLNFEVERRTQVIVDTVISYLSENNPKDLL